ncbi:MAG: hypothetical protein F6J89_07445 [Symploca sp. SIO1C4]|uniref:PBP domain-containing protein n=1 Tax=Symploca sp. SIO1C4 TaxID=2607765 RepID=A0A6B3NE81_9CYAN|nr:hypothetical protein [Symploca sp. SIO1C4]
MAGWICNGIPKDNKPHPEQHTSGEHEPYENFGSDCVICGLSKEAIVGGSKVPIKIIAAATTGVVVVAILLWILYKIFNSDSPSQDLVNDNLVTPNPSPTSATTSTSNSSVSISPPPKITTYRTFTDVSDIPQMNVRYGGSTSFAPLRTPQNLPQMELLIEQAHPDFNLIYTEPPPGIKPGSGAGIQMLLDSQLSVAQSSRPLKEKEYESAKTRGFALEQHAVAIDGIALYVNPEISIPGLTAAQVKDIYTGKITNWNQVGGPNLPITPFSRDPEDGGTPEFFREKVLSGESLASFVQPYVRDTTESLRKVASTPGGIGYATASEVCNQSTIRPFPLARRQGQSFVEPCVGEIVNQAAFASDSYPITRRLFVIIKRDGTLDEQAGVAYTNLLLSDEGQEIVDQVGLVRIR